MTIREFTSTIQQSSVEREDDFISDEYIYTIGISISKLLIKRETESRKLFKITSLFQTLPCVEMIPAPESECGPGINCSNLQRSKKRIPKTYLTNFGSLIQVFNVLRNVDYKEVTPTQYKNIKLQKYKSKDTKYFWIDDDYLYIPDSEVEFVIVSMLSPSGSDVEEFNTEKASCSGFLDSEFPAPPYMISTILAETLSHVFNRKRVPSDEDPNLNLLKK